MTVSFLLIDTPCTCAKQSGINGQVRKMWPITSKPTMLWSASYMFLFSKFSLWCKLWASLVYSNKSSKTGKIYLLRNFHQKNELWKRETCNWRQLAGSDVMVTNDETCGCSISYYDANHTSLYMHIYVWLQCAKKVTVQ